MSRTGHGRLSRPCSVFFGYSNQPLHQRRSNGVFWVNRIDHECESLTAMLRQSAEVAVADDSIP